MSKLTLAAALAALIPISAAAAPGHAAAHGGAHGGGWHSGWHGGAHGGGWHSGWHGGYGWHAPHRWAGWGGAVVIGPAYYPAPYYGWYYPPAPVFYPTYVPVVVQQQVYQAPPAAPRQHSVAPLARQPAPSSMAPPTQPYSSTTTQRGGTTLPARADRN